MMRDMELLRRIRCFVGYTQLDASRRTGIPLHRLAAAEAGKIALHHCERAQLRLFLVGRLQSIAERERASMPGTDTMIFELLTSLVEAAIPAPGEERTIDV